MEIKNKRNDYKIEAYKKQQKKKRKINTKTTDNKNKERKTGWKKERKKERKKGRKKTRKKEWKKERKKERRKNQRKRQPKRRRKADNRKKSEKQTNKEVSRKANKQASKPTKEQTKKPQDGRIKEQTNSSHISTTNSSINQQQQHCKNYSNTTPAMACNGNKVGRSYSNSGSNRGNQSEENDIWLEVVRSVSFTQYFYGTAGMHWVRSSFLWHDNLISWVIKTYPPLS